MRMHMKYLFKNFIAMIAALAVILSLGTVTYAKETANMDEITIQSLEDELKAYLAENHSEIEFGTVAFIEYLMGVMVEHSDEALAALPNYPAIR